MKTNQWKHSPDQLTTFLSGELPCSGQERTNRRTVPKNSRLTLIHFYIWIFFRHKGACFIFAEKRNETTGKRQSKRVPCTAQKNKLSTFRSSHATCDLFVTSVSNQFLDIFLWSFFSNGPSQEKRQIIFFFFFFFFEFFKFSWPTAVLSDIQNGKNLCPKQMTFCARFPVLNRFAGKKQA